MSADGNADISFLSKGPRKRRTYNKRTDEPTTRPTIRQEFPDIVQVATTFMEQNGFEAHRRRQTDTGTCGVTLGQVKDHLFNEVEGLREKRPKLAITTIARWLQPPGRRFSASDRYGGLIDARVPPKSNSRRSENPNDHYYSARVRYCKEFVAMNTKEAFIISGGNKNKVKLGSSALAVDHRLQIRRYFPSTDVPDYYDHDFPTPGYLITPGGYLEMDPSPDVEVTTDEYSRKSHKLPTPVGATVINRSPQSPVNIATHVNDLIPIVTERVERDGKTCLVLFVDGGPDFNPNHLANVLYYTRLFKACKLDGLIATQYCPGHSALNPVERLWSPLTQALVSVYLPDTSDGDAKAPCNTAGLSVEERTTREAEVFDHGMALLSHYWSDVTVGGKPLKIVNKASGEHEAPFSDYKDVHALLKGSQRSLMGNPELMSELEFLRDHVDRRVGQCIVRKCGGMNCEYCTQFPVRAPNVVSCLRSFPSPLPDACKGTSARFITFTDALKVTDGPMPDSHMPYLQERGLQRCRPCNWTYLSAADYTRHQRMFHPKRRRSATD